MCADDLVQSTTVKIKTSLSLNQRTLTKVKREAARQRRSVSGLVEIWIEDELLAALRKQRTPNGKEATA